MIITSNFIFDESGAEVMLDGKLTDVRALAGPFATVRYCRNILLPFAHVKKKEKRKKKERKGENYTMLFLFLASLICLDASRVFKLHSFKSSHPSSQCSDGSPTGMYINQSSSGSASWIIFLEGGGWCYDEVTCKGRPSSLISSKGWPSVATYQGLLAPTSPELVDANAVFLRYCTNDAWVGSVESPFSDWKFSMLGRVYIDAVLQELVHSYGLGSTAGTKVMFSGCSAGARGAMFNSFFASQRLKTLISPPSNLLAFGSFFDSAWWMDVDPLSSNAVPFRTQVQDVYALTNAGAPGYLNPACMAAFPGADGWKCMMGEYAENYTQESVSVCV